MKAVESNVACAGMDVHYKFSSVTFRDADGRVVSRQRLDHPDRKQLASRVGLWPRGIPVVMEASFGSASQGFVGPAPYAKEEVVEVYKIMGIEKKKIATFHSQ